MNVVLSIFIFVFGILGVIYLGEVTNNILVNIIGGSFVGGLAGYVWSWR